jgi:phosphomannomutase
VASIDGDADRLIYFHRGQNRPINITGDKIFCFLMMYIVEKLELLGIEKQVNHCLINTAYTNSQALKFLKANDINTFQVPTGVKNAYNEIRKYVIGAHCDRVGHGTFYVRWDWLNKALIGKEDRIEAKKLKALLEIPYAGCGDAIANLLMVEAILRDKDYSIQMLYNIYKELPNK